MKAARRLLDDQRGVALPVALAVLFAVATLAAIAARSGVTANTQSFRDRNVKRAIQAALAGVDATIYQMNLLEPAEKECVVRGAGGALQVSPAPVSGWCSAQTESLDSGAAYSVEASQSTQLRMNSNGQYVTFRKIVSTGTVNGVKRRVYVTVTSPSGTPLFPKGYAGVSLSPISFGNSVTINGALGSNGDITLSNTARVCGAVTPGPGKKLTLNQSASQCAGYPKVAAQQPFVLSPVNQRGASTTNDNGRICAAGPSSDPCTNTGGMSWNPATRVLSMGNQSTLTLTGNTYSFCRIQMSQQAKIIIAARDVTRPLRIYMDSPQNCGGGAGMGSVVLGQGASIVNMNADPASFMLLAVGSTTIATIIDLGQTGSPDPDIVMGIYAPYSTVILRNSVKLRGAVAAKTLQMENSSSITYDSLVESFSEDTSTFYQRSDYVECTNVKTGSAPDTGC